MNESSPEVNSYGGYLSMDDNVCLYQAYDNSIPDDIDMNLCDDND